MHGAKCSKYHISAAVLLETISNILDLDLIHNIHISRCEAKGGSLMIIHNKEQQEYYMSAAHNDNQDENG